MLLLALASGCGRLPLAGRLENCTPDHISVSPAVGVGTKDLVLKATMTSRGKPVVGQSIDFYLYVKRGRVYVAGTEATTDNDGVAAAKLPWSYNVAPYLQKEVLTANWFEASYSKSLVAASKAHPYCDTNGYAAVSFQSASPG